MAERRDGGVTETLWTDAARGRRFLIPDAIALPSGDLVLRTAIGRECTVDCTAAAAYEVTPEQAKTWAKASLEEVLGQLRTGLGAALGVGSAAAPADAGDVAPHPRATPPDEARPTPGLDLLADLTDRPRHELAGDYSAMGRALREHLGDLGRAALDSVSGDPERMAAAKARMAAWNETLKSRGVGAAGVRKSDAPVTAHKASDSDAEEHRSGASDDHPGDGTGAPESEAGRSDIAAQLRAMADAMRRRADALAAAREAAVRDASPSPDAGPSNASDTTGNNPTEGNPGRG